MRKIVNILLLFMCVTLVIFGLALNNFINRPLNIVSNQIFYVPTGSSIISIAKTLHSKGVLAHPNWFIFFAKMKGGVKTIKAGEYQIEVGLTPTALFTKLLNGKVFLRRFTIIEGWTVKQVFASIQSNPYLSQTTTRLVPLEFAQKLGTSQLSFEGYFYPDTYLFTKGIPDIVILKKAFQTMQQKLQLLWAKRAKDLPFQNPYSALIVASLIEKETARPEERAKIAGVIVRRLKMGMPLQIDAAVIYGLGEGYRGTLSHEDLKKDTPYNIYMHKGLPPTPIGMPSLPSLQAAMHPEAGTALYYVARGNGTHEFTSNLQEHHNATRKFRIKSVAKGENLW